VVEHAPDKRSLKLRTPTPGWAFDPETQEDPGNAFEVAKFIVLIVCRSKIGSLLCACLEGGYLFFSLAHHRKIT
jgi:hypothetical protein